MELNTILPDSKMDGSSTVTSRGDEIAALLSIPATAFRFHLCPFLTAFDLLRLRETSKRCYDMLHRDEGEFCVRTFVMQKLSLRMCNVLTFAHILTFFPMLSRIGKDVADTTTA